MVKIPIKKEENMKLPISIVLFIVIPLSLLAQSKTEDDINLAFQNAKKGIYWALENIPAKKASLDSDLIAEDKLYASVKINREVNGVKVVSKGYHLTNHVEITIYKSYDILKSEGYNVPTGEW